MSTVGDFRVIRVQPGKREEYLRLMQPLCRQVETEAGTLIYLLHTDHDQPDTVWLYARFRDGAALAAHRSTPVFAKVTRDARALEVEADILDVQLVGNKGVPFEPRGMRDLAE
jgi:quinol monooxygenase YgiN